MFRLLHRFLVALFEKETVCATYAGRQMTRLQEQIDSVEENFAKPADDGQCEVPEEARLLLDSAKTHLADAKASVEKPSKSKFVRSWRLLEAYDLACAGDDIQTRAFWACHNARMLTRSESSQTKS
jgi:hypothetical protein